MACGCSLWPHRSVYGVLCFWDFAGCRLGVVEAWGPVGGGGCVSVGGALSGTVLLLDCVSQAGVYTQCVLFSRTHE